MGKKSKVVFDQARAINNLLMNYPIQQFHIFDLRKSQDFSQNNYYLRSNTSQLYALLLLQITHFGLYLNPGRHPILVGLVFSLYLWITIRKYQRFKHLKSLRILIPTLLQQIFLLVIGFLIAINFTTTAGSVTPFKLVT